MLGWHDRPFVIVAALCAAGMLMPVAAVATTPTPAIPSNVHIVGGTSTSLTVTGTSRYATRYQVFASATKTDVYVSNLSRAHKSAVTSSSRPTVGGLTYVAAPVYYRLEVFNDTHHAYSAIYSGGLRPATPTNLRVTSGASGLWLTWRGGAASGAAIAQATDVGLTLNRRTYTIRGTGRQFTPYGLTKGTTYYFRVQAVNQATLSGFSSEVSAAAATSSQSVRMMTYNLTEGSSNPGMESGQPFGTWEQRRSGVVKLIREANPDVIAIQEAAAYVGYPQGYGGTRQVDDLVSLLGGDYELAYTETPPTQHGYFRTGDYVLYKASAYTAVANGGHWIMPGSPDRYAAYQLLQDNVTGAKAVFVSPHLLVGVGATNDSLRRQETESLLSQAANYDATVGHVPVMYAGDFNSDVNSGHAFDGPTLAMHAVNAVDNQDSAQVLVNHRYNSANGNSRTPPAFGQSIDHVYAPPGVAVVDWRLYLDLVNGQFVGWIPSDHNPLVSTMVYPY